MERKNSYNNKMINCNDSKYRLKKCIITYCSFKNYIKEIIPSSKILNHNEEKKYNFFNFQLVESSC